MIIKEYTHKEQLIIPKYVYQYVSCNNTVIFDIETTGLSKYHNKVILIGYLFAEDGQIKIRQLFAEDSSEEGLILLEFMKDISNFDTMITYNGATFDCPFLKERFIQHKLEWPGETLEHIDILKHLRKNKEYLKIDNFKLKTVEKYLGINRKDIISGEDSVRLYNQFTKKRSAALLEKILLHNYEDIYYLGKVLDIFKFIPEEVYKKWQHIVHLDDEAISFSFFPTDFSFKSKAITLVGRSSKNNNLPQLKHYHQGFSFFWDPSLGSFKLDIPLFNTKLNSGKKIHFIDLRVLNISRENQVYQNNEQLYEEHFLHVDIHSPNLQPFEGLILEIITMAIRTPYVQ
ncbi:ribonuclease H-like domain-containing protein [Alkaliphilus peptidifermentans]|uniref:YprB ribonuclease H-like domain-containing protein n=1 Tax=Alkaliphilus peptidifermentans DSM 18978 TaxID=1120976 RepID=A0A1G5CF24_9FIRM|nr:ribonuclease H-like domain-containing protein [Alkaliphilus peptidifermentans]SCY01135.1 hypothetical protein SAMN03080606_00649 [Alkaliphilus peptidifermentans DSM 18978]